MPLQTSIPLDSIRGFCTARYLEEWYLACVLDVNHVEKEVELTFMHPKGPAPSFVYPDPADILTVDASDILSMCSPNTQTGRTYTMTKAEMKQATDALVQK